jgi:hypothetical protein
MHRAVCGREWRKGSRARVAVSGGSWREKNINKSNKLPIDRVLVLVTVAAMPSASQWVGELALLVGGGLVVLALEQISVALLPLIEGLRRGGARAAPDEESERVVPRGIIRPPPKQPLTPEQRSDGEPARSPADAWKRVWSSFMFPEQNAPPPSASPAAASPAPVEPDSSAPAAVVARPASDEPPPPRLSEGDVRSRVRQYAAMIDGAWVGVGARALSSRVRFSRRAMAGAPEHVATFQLHLSARKVFDTFWADAAVDGVALPPAGAQPDARERREDETFYATFLRVCAMNDDVRAGRWTQPAEGADASDGREDLDARPAAGRLRRISTLHPLATKIKFPGVPTHVQTLKWQLAVELPAAEREPDEAPEPWRLAIVESSHFQGVPYCSAFAVETVWIVEAAPSGASPEDTNDADSALVRVFFRIDYAIDFPGFVRKLLEIGSRRELRHVYAKWAELTGESSGL